MNSVATEVSVEILVLFEQRHRNPLPRQQERQHHPARTAAYHAAVSLSPVTNGFGGDKIGCVLWNGRHTRHSRYKIALATSATARNREATLRLLGISNLFHAVVDASGHQRPKPDPEVFLTALEKLQLRADDCWIIEDSVNGLRAAKAAGCYSVALSTTFDRVKLSSAGADIVVDSFAELREFLESL
jgi:hypothetical protein